MRTLTSAAATVTVVLALTGCSPTAPASATGGASSSPRPSPSSAAASPVAAAPLPASGLLTPGRYAIRRPFPVELDLAVGDGWGVFSGAESCCVLLEHDGHRPPGLVLFNVYTIDGVYRDPCQHVPGDQVGPGVDALVTALRAVPALGAAAPEPATVGGLSATHLVLRLPGDIDISACLDDEFWMWSFDGSEARHTPVGFHAVEDELWILEVGGERIVLDGVLSEAADADREQLADLIASVSFPGVS